MSISQPLDYNNIQKKLIQTFVETKEAKNRMSIVKLAQATNKSSFGTKAANLAKLIAGGINVPDGFAISIDSFYKNSLRKDAIEEIVQLVDETKLYAVRSSAIVEDSNHYSWAGLFETYLNVKPTDLVSKIYDCSQSAKERARTYINSGIHDHKIAVIVQEMINAEYSGVLFTKNPITNKDGFSVEYTEGLCDSLTDGKIDPKTLNSRNDHKAPFDIDQLFRIAEKINNIFSCPQDIEWASVDNEIWILQSRPITTLKKSNHRTHTENNFSDQNSEYILTGKVACNAGLNSITGEVIVINNASEIVGDNKIFVTPFTDPNFVPKMRQAKALITDHGGIMSHAAIIAREFSLPCIVGTNNGTELLNTGDKITIDLNNGKIWRILAK